MGSYSHPLSAINQEVPDQGIRYSDCCLKAVGPDLVLVVTGVLMNEELHVVLGSNQSSV